MTCFRFLTQSTFVAGRRRRDFSDPSLARTHAQSRAELESSRARVPYIAGWESSSATVLRTRAQQSKRTRSPAAYGLGQLTAQRLAQRQPTRSTGPMRWPRSRQFRKNRSSHVTQIRIVGIMSIRHSCEHMCSHARRLNPLARGYPP